MKPAKSQTVESNSFTKKDAMAWFDATYRTGGDLANDIFVSPKALDFFEKETEKGDLDALCCLGLLYITGSAVNVPDRPRGREMLAKAAVGGNVGAAYCLARFYENQQEDEQQVVKWFQMAAQGGHPRAQYYLGLRYEEGRGADKNEEMALKYLRQAAKQGHKEAQSLLKIKYNEVQDDEKDEAKTLLSPRRSSKDEDEISSRGILAMLSPRRESKASTVDESLSPRRESRASTVDESLSPKRNKKPSMVKGELSPQRKNAEPSMVKSLHSPKRERRTEESGKATSTWGWLSPKRDNRREDGVPELTLGSSSSMKDASPKRNRKLSMVKEELNPQRENAKPGMVKSLLSPKREKRTEESGKATSTCGWLSPKRDNRREGGVPELTLGSSNSMRDPCQSMAESSRLSHSYGSIRRREPRGTFFAPKINADNTIKGGLSNSLQLSFELGNKRDSCREDELTLGGLNSMRDPCQSIVENTRLSDSYGSIRKREPRGTVAFFDQKTNAANAIKGGLSNSLQLSFELGNKK